MRCCLSHFRFQYVIGMDECGLGRIEHHSWTCPSHHPADGFTLFGGIAVNGAYLAQGLLLAKMAVVQSLPGIGRQLLILFWHGGLMKMMPTVYLNHLTYGFLLALNLTHNGDKLLCLICTCLIMIWYTRTESNRDQRNRNPLFYPLNYGCLRY